MSKEPPEWAIQKAKDLIAWQVIYDSGNLAKTMKNDIARALAETREKALDDVLKLIEQYVGLEPLAADLRALKHSSEDNERG